MQQLVTARWILILCFLSWGLLPAQEEVKDFTEEMVTKDRSRESMFNAANPNAALVGGGNFYVSNPAPAYEVDVDKAYLNPEFQPFVVTLIDGQSFEVPARLRLIDQRIEVMVEGQAYDLDGQVLRDATDHRGRTFVSMFDPTGRIRGAQLYELAFVGKTNRLLVNVATVWEDPPRQNMFDTREATRKLKEVTRVYLVTSVGSTEVNQVKDLLTGLRLDRNDRAYRYAKSKKLKNRLGDFIRLLEFVEPGAD
ncbi:hypothetical protein [Lewinella sp. JB7]|uniref:hypothetical protein n=1 Tax=Lewinella sp. JB7 TaxID=2962887 RepID=UPI0020C9FB56|nr:hypothetical protein [Lewinella sp. JB7]MCP9236055.1 hypothetical protein [Lewinella sp. JB7]